MMTESNLTRLHAVIEGRVQGVGFRAFAIRKAEELGLNGWVRNRWDGSVEITAEGERVMLDKFVAALFIGPASANVTRLAPEWQSATGEFSRFSARSSA